MKFANFIADKANAARTSAQIALIGASISAQRLMAYAGQTQTLHTATNENINGVSMVETITNTIAGVFPWIGAFFILMGAFKVFLAFRNDQPESMTGAVKDIIVGVIFVAFKAFIWTSLSNMIFK